MHLAMITTYATPGNMRRELLEAVRANGHAVTVISPETPGMADALASLGGTYVPWEIDRTGLDPRRDARSAHALTQILRAARADVVLCYQVKAVLLAPAAAKLARVPRVVALVNGLGTVFEDTGFGRTWRARVARVGYRMSLHAVDLVVFHNRDDEARLRALNLLGNTRSRVVPGSGIDLVKFAPGARWPGPPTFTLISRLLIAKGIREFVDAARLVRAKHPEARFHLVGPVEAGHPDGITQAELDGWVRDGLVHYSAFEPDVRRVLAETTVYVLPSHHEGMPRTNLEAMAMGLPVVTSDAPGCRDTVEDGVTGVLVPLHDPPALAAALERYLREPDLIERHGAAGRVRAERFSIGTINSAMLESLGL
jgi:glycosyltransferase involved in cell wall biosynthesis